MKREAAILLLLGALGCAAPGPHTRAGGAVSAMAVVPVEWNPTHAATGEVRAVVDDGNVVTVFSVDGATVMTAAAVQARDTTRRAWIGGSVIPGADGSERWVVGVTEGGRLYHLRGSTSFEDVSPRYGLGSGRIRAASTVLPALAALLVGDEVVTAGGDEVRHWPAPGLRDLAGGGGLAAGTVEDAVVVFDFGHAATWRFPLPGVTHAALDGSGHLYATTHRGLFTTTDARHFRLLFDAGSSRLGDLVVSGDAAWFVDGDELAVALAGRVLETTGARIPRDAKLFPSPTGDVWVISHGVVSRLARARVSPSSATTWQRELAPVFSRSCAACHLPNGIANVDLSSAEAWTRKRAEIRTRVLEEKSMPPRGHSLSDIDREVVRRWIGAGSL